MTPQGHATSAKAGSLGFALLFCFCFAVPSAIDGQQSTATVNGTIFDPSGAVVPSSEVYLINMQTSVVQHTVTDNAGLYVFLNIIPGQYTMRASKPGFKRVDQSAFSLAVNQTATVNFTLPVGATGQEVTVHATGTQLESSTAELGSVVTQQQVTDLPLNGRNFTQLLALTPGVAPVSVTQNAGGFGAITTAGSQFTFPSINGQQNVSNYYMLDGINNNSTFTNAYAVPPIIDTVQEFKVQSHNDEAEFGQAIGGIVNVITKSGTNEFHGTAWEFLRNDALDARNTFLQTKTPFRQNQFGVTAGGPVWIPKLYNGRNKTFFYGGYQGFRYRSSQETLFRVPTAANLAGDLSDDPRQIYNPFTTRPDPNHSGQFIRDPFPNNQIPAALIDPGLVLYAKTILPMPVVTGVPGKNAIDNTPYKQNQTEWSTRVDQMAGDRNFFWFRYARLDQDVDSSGGIPSLANIGNNFAYNLGVNPGFPFLSVYS